MKTTVSLSSMKTAARNWNDGWRTWVIADQTGGCVSYWNADRYPRMVAA